MKLTENQQDKVRWYLQGGFDLFAAVLSIVRWMIWSIAIAAVLALFAGLLTADPDTTTFRDFLLAAQSQNVQRVIIMVGGMVGVIGWGINVMFGRKAVYPVAAVAQGRASRSSAKDEAQPNKPE